MVSRIGMREVLGCCNHQEGEEDQEERAEPVHGASDQEGVRSCGHISSLEMLIGDELLK